MKKNIFRICVFLFTGQIMFNGTNAQTTLTETGYKKNIRFENQVSSSEESKSFPDSQVIVLNYINIKAIRDFTRSYKNVTDAKWFKSNSDYMVYFTSDGIRSRIYYDKNGSRGTMIRFYYQEQLPADSYKTIRTAYFDYHIVRVTEITSKQTIAYVVKLEGNDRWKTIKLIEGELEETEEFFKKAEEKKAIVYH